ncbi:glucoamylase family protein [Salegentibacter sp. HM20]
MLRVFYVLGMLMIFSACSNDSGPGYQEPYIPGADKDKDNVEVLDDDELLEKVQQTTFKYFWEFAGTNSGLAKERSQAEAYGGQGDNIVTMGGSGFGIAAFPVAVERGWISRNQAVQRLDKILNFLENVPTYHGAFSHWYLDDSGETRAFSEKDNGGDLVETAFLMQGLLIARQYFSEEEDLNARITALWEAVEWDWYTQGENVLYWHWSPNFGFQMNLPIRGWNESLIVYVLAAGSPTHPIEPEIYHQGWASNGNMVNNRQHYGIDLPLGPAYGGPLFFAHYSFIGLDPRNLSDQYAHYFEQNRAHSLIHYNYAIDNPRNFEGYGENSWGFTASDNYEGYSAHSPANDLGVITPTAALSSFPYTPEESMKALRYFYEEMGDELWGPYGFYDAFSEEENWVADGYLAIDQGPIISMIENHRTGLLWNLFMADEEVQRGLDRLNFNY